MNFKKLAVIILLGLGLIGAVIFFFTKGTDNNYILKNLRIEQSIADQTIQDMKPALYSSCAKYKQAQLDRDNLQLRITTIVNSKYEDTPKSPKLKTMEVDNFCRFVVNKLSYTFSKNQFLGLEQEHQLPKLSGHDLIGTGN